MALRFATSCSCRPHLFRKSSGLLTSCPSCVFPSCRAPESFHLRVGSTRLRPSCTALENGLGSSPEGSLAEPTFSDETPPSSSNSAAASAFYTSMKEDPLQFWETHEAIQPSGESGRALEADDDQMLLTELRLLANAAADRAQMHNILAQQRDNWNKLFQRFLTMATMTATVLAGLNGQQHSLSLSLPAFFLDAGSAFMMAVINQFQPSQLAEEQRTAFRLFTKLVNDIEYALLVSPALRQDTAALLQDSQRRLQALDRAYPMELTPGGLEKFPSRVVPPVLSNQPINASVPAKVAQCEVNGWNESISRDLSEVATLLHDSDVAKYVSWAQNVVKVNKCLAVAAPLFALSGAALNAVDALGWSNEMGVHAAMCSVLAAFAGSVSHDLQLGMVFELYRFSAGYYAEMKVSIDKTLKAPADQRENAVLFRRRVANELGRDGGQGPLVPPEAKSGGTLF